MKNPPANPGDARDSDLIPGSKRSLEKEMATHSRILTWKIPWTEQPGGIQSTGHKELDTTEHAHMHTHTLNKTPGKIRESVLFKNFSMTKEKQQ